MKIHYDKNTLLAFAALIFALLLWALFAWRAYAVIADDQSALAQSTSQSNAASAYVTALREHASALAAASSTHEIDSILNVDIVSIAAMMNATASSTRVAFSIGDVSPAIASKNAALTPSIHAYDMTVTVQGGFEALMRTEQAFEEMPFPTSIQSFDLEEQAAAETASHALPQWQLTAHIRVFTSAAPTS